MERLDSIEQFELRSVLGSPDRHFYMAARKHAEGVISTPRVWNELPLGVRRELCGIAFVVIAGGVALRNFDQKVSGDSLIDKIVQYQELSKLSRRGRGFYSASLQHADGERRDDVAIWLSGEAESWRIAWLTLERMH